MILSSNGYLVWKSVPNQVNFTSPYTMSLLDEGRFVVKNGNQEEIWESWPMNGISDAETIFRPIEYNYVPCNGRPLKVRKNLTSIDGNNVMNSKERLLSSNGFWDLVVLDKTRLVLRKFKVVKHELASFRFSIGKLVLQKDGNLIIESNSSNEMWNSKIWRSKASKMGPFKLEVTNGGSLIVQNNRNKTIYEFPRKKNVFKQLESDAVYNLKDGDSLKTANWEIKLIDKKLVKKHGHTIKNLNWPHFDEEEIQEKVDEVVITNEGKIVLYGDKDEILWQNDVTNGPFSLELNDENGLETVWSNCK